MKIKYFLYNSFLIEDEQTKIAIDPGLNLWLFKLRSLIPKQEWTTVTHVLVTHGDPDHFVYAVPMAQKAGATVVCREALMADFLSNSVEDVHKIDVGAIVKLENVTIEGLNAAHGPLSIKLLAGFIHIKN